MLPPDTTQTILPVPALPESATATGQAPAPLGDHPVALREEPHRLFDLGDARGEGAVEELLRERPHLLEQATAADAVHEGAPTLDLRHLARREGGGQRRGGVDLGREDPRGLVKLPDAARDPRGEPAAAPRDQHDVRVGQVVEDLERDRAVPRHHGLVFHGVEEVALDAVEAPLRHAAPPLVVGHAEVAGAEPLDRFELRLRCVLGHDDRAGDATLARDPGDALGPVARARGEDAPVEGAFGCEAEGVDGAPDLERRDRLEVLELEVDLGLALVGAQPDERRSQRAPGDGLVGFTDVVERDHVYVYINDAERAASPAGSRGRIWAMLLVADVGNTKSALGIVRGGQWIADWRITTHPDYLEDEYYVLLKSLLEDQGLSFSEISGAVMASVVPPLTATFDSLLKRLIGEPPVIVGPDVETGIRILVDHPGEVGADRIANTAAVQELYGGPAIVADLGTATTFDVVSKDGEYLGGAIAPGLGISADALVSRTAKLPKVELTLPESSIGRNTVSAMQSGLVLGYLGLVKELIARLSAEVPGAPKVIATGGMAEIVSEWSQAIDIVSPRLTLEGLRIIYELNRR